jgi:hypothetical protein
MSVNLVAAEELLKVEAVVASLRELDATAEGREALAMAQAGFTHPDDM